MLKTSILLILALAAINHCLIVVPERTNVTEWSDKYLHYVRVYITRTNRKSPYFINIEAHLKQSWTNNVTVNFVYYEYLHNEYRRSFVEIHAQVCNFLNKDVFLGKMFKNLGFSCPVKAGPYRISNMTVPMQDFKYQFPFQKFRAYIDIIHTTTKDVMCKGYIDASFKHK
ncbi:hypothetical protein evm_012180 [Chilo suppressalis]|nr:hypothetical protein evm_012180 [Chilo suppressalis]